MSSVCVVSHLHANDELLKNQGSPSRTSFTAVATSVGHITRVGHPPHE